MKEFFRPARRSLAAATAILLSGCVDPSALSTGNGPPGDVSSHDLAVAPDLASRVDLAVSPDLAVVRDLAVAPPDLVTTMPKACTSTNDCGGNPCCMTLAASKVQSVSCAAKASDCAPAVDFSGNGQTRICTKDADCTSGLMSSSLPDCCTATQGGAAVHICFSKSLAGFTMGQITCP